MYAADFAPKFDWHKFRNHWGWDDDDEEKGKRLA